MAAHVEGCPRTGMPLRSEHVRLTRDELQFLKDRIDHAPPAVSDAREPYHPFLLFVFRPILIPSLLPLQPAINVSVKYAERVLSRPDDYGLLNQVSVRLLLICCTSM